MMRKFVFASIFLILSVCLVTVPAPAAEVEQVTFDDSYSDQPDGVFDAAGNAHVVWSDLRDGSWEIYYKMVDESGTVLIDDTRLTMAASMTHKRPRVAIDSAGRLFVVWQGRGDFNNSPYLVRVEPALDDRDGSPATAGSIVTLGPLTLQSITDADDQHYTPAIAIDDDGALHLVWENALDYEILYRKLDGDGGQLVAEKLLNPGSSLSGQRTTPDLALDFNGDVHIVWSDEGFDAEIEVYYTMLDGATGDTLIAATRMTDDDGLRSWYPTINLDGRGMAYLVFMDGLSWFNASDPLELPEILFMKFDPSLDDQDGSTAVAGSITVIPATELTPRDGVPNIRPYSRLIGSRLMVSHYEWDDQDTFSDANLSLLWVDLSGSVVKEEMLSSTAGAFNNHWNSARMTRTGSNTFAVIWSDTRWGGSTNLAATELSTGTGGGGGGGGGCSTVRHGQVDVWHGGLMDALLAGLVLVLFFRIRGLRPR